MYNEVDSVCIKVSGIYLEIIVYPWCKNLNLNKILKNGSTTLTHL